MLTTAGGGKSLSPTAGQQIAVCEEVAFAWRDVLFMINSCKDISFVLSCKVKQSWETANIFIVFLHGKSLCTIRNLLLPGCIRNYGHAIRNLSTRMFTASPYICSVIQKEPIYRMIMNKKVLILSSSPRRGGNTDTLCDEFMRGAIEGGNEAEKIFLRDKTIHYCTGCSTCSLRQKPCPQKDDAAGLIEKMLQADVIVLSTPRLLLCNERPTENLPRPLLRALYGNEQQRILFHRCRCRGRSGASGTGAHVRQPHGIYRLSGKSYSPRSVACHRCLACR